MTLTFGRKSLIAFGILSIVLQILWPRLAVVGNVIGFIAIWLLVNKIETNIAVVRHLLEVRKDAPGD